MRLGELCAGYGGLGMAVEEVFGATTAWFSEYDAAPSKILAHHWPTVPNYGDMTKIDWANIEPADIISGGTPCQDLSGAGRRAGMTEGTRSNLWVQMREAIAIQKPKYVVWENVRGAYSATAASDLEQCSGCMGDAADRGVVLRALGRVLGDLSDLGYDTQWRGLRAADVGACHGRFRVFVLAVDSGRVGGAQTQQHHGRGPATNHRPTLPHEPDSDLMWSGSKRRSVIQNPNFPARGERRFAASGQAESGRAWSDAGGRSGTPVANAASARRAEGQDGGAGNCHAGEGAWGLEFERGGRESATPDPNSRDDAGREQGQEWGAFRGAASEWGSGSNIDWAEYTPAIRRWESVMGRRSPAPTELSAKGGHRLSPRFTEWMMGLPDGWVTDPAIGISRNEQLKACGNGVVPQQAMAALRDMLAALDAKEMAA